MINNTSNDMMNDVMDKINTSIDEMLSATNNFYNLIKFLIDNKNTYLNKSDTFTYEYNNCLYTCKIKVHGKIITGLYETQDGYKYDGVIRDDMFTCSNLHGPNNLNCMGNILNNNFCGTGMLSIMISNVMYTYNGDFLNGKFHGRGKLAHNKVYVGYDYEGDFLNGKFHGRGKLTYNEVNVGYDYEGDFSNGMFHGRGILKEPNGRVYEGNFLNGQKDYTHVHNIKPEHLRSVKIQKQKFGDCWAHAIARNFVRTFFILQVIKKDYISQFYHLFFTILTMERGCNGGNESLDSLNLLDYLKKNYSGNIFNIINSSSKCHESYCDENSMFLPILSMSDIDKNEIIRDFDYLFSNNLLFIGKYVYTIDQNIDNLPSKAIHKMLQFKLQPCVGIFLNMYLSEKISNYGSYPSINSNNNLVDDNDKFKCTESSGHLVNLRRWKRDYIELKNSYGINSANDGNFSVKDLKYLTCKKSNENVHDITFVSLMFDHDSLNDEFKEKVNYMTSELYKTIDDDVDVNIEIDINKKLDNLGFLSGHNTVKYDNETYIGMFKHGMMNGHGEVVILNEFKYKGLFENDNLVRGKFTLPSGTTYEGTFENKKLIQGTLTLSNGYTYEGTFENEKLIQGTLTLPDGDTYKGTFEKGNLIQGTLTSPNRRTYEGTFKNYNLVQGKSTSPDGYRYEGTFENGKLVRGKSISPDGHIHEGIFKNDKLTEGKIELSDGHTFEGIFENGNILRGKSISPDKYTYEGTFENGKLVRGKSTLPNGYTYEGIFENEKLIGGKSTLPNKYTYEGIFKNGKLVQGKMTSPNGYTREGIFINDELTEGKFMLSDGHTFEGIFKNNKLIEGKSTSPNGHIHEGIFENDELVQGKITFSNGSTKQGTFKNGKLVEGIITLSNGYTKKISTL